MILKGGVVLTEVHPDKRFLVVQNQGEASVDMTGWTIKFHLGEVCGDSLTGEHTRLAMSLHFACPCDWVACRGTWCTTSRATSRSPGTPRSPFGRSMWARARGGARLPVMTEVSWSGA